MRGPSSLVRADIAAMRPYQPGEQPTDRTLIKLNTNENPYPASPRVAEAVAHAASGLSRYPSPTADDLCSKAASVYGVDPEQVLAGNGSDEILAICLRSCVEPTASVAYAVPTYSLYASLVAIAGGSVLEVARGHDQGLTALADSGASIVFVCSPNSPSGDAVELDRIATLAEALDGVVVVDEAYVDFSDRSALSILPDHANMVVTRSFSKSFSLAGLRLGLLFADPGLVAEFRKVKDSVQRIFFGLRRRCGSAGRPSVDAG